MVGTMPTKCLKREWTAKRRLQKRIWWTQVKRAVIDHIKNDGAAHRKQVGVSFYRWLQTHGYPKGFQVLCANHNLKKHLIWMRSLLPPLS